MGGTTYTEPPVNPPRQAMAASSGSAVASGTAAATVVVVPFMFAWTLAFLGAPGAAAEGKVLVNVPLASGLMLAAIVLAGLALTFTALSVKRPKDAAERVQVSMVPLMTFIVLNLLGLTFDTLALALLAQTKFQGFRMAALVGTLLEVAAVIVGVRRHMAAARELEGAKARQVPRPATGRS